MPLWNRTDDTNGPPLFVGTLANQPPTVAARNSMYGNTTSGAFVPDKTVGVFGVSDAEKNSANVSSEASKVVHTGWVLRTVGSGGRAGRVMMETLVAGSNVDGANTTIDDAIFP